MADAAWPLSNASKPITTSSTRLLTLTTPIPTAIQPPCTENSQEHHRKRLLFKRVLYQSLPDRQRVEMSSENEDPQPPPTPAQIADLKRLAAGIIRAQGNRFIKELLRAKGIRIGATKDVFERYLTEAIETGKLTLDDVRDWLKSIEGWGNQHVYLYRISSTLRRDLTKPKIRQRVQDGGLEAVWDGETVLAFPEEPTLTSISFNDSVLRLVWHESSPGWTPVPEKNYTVEEGLDTFEYRAWRKIEKRAITRFEAHLDKEIAALFIPDPIIGSEHQAALDEAKRVVSLLMDLSALERGQMDISVVSRNLDQQNVPTNVAPNPGVKAQKSRLTSGGAYVEFAATSSDKAYWEETAIKNVRSSVRTPQLGAFQGTGGVFIFQAEDGPNGLKRPLRVQLYGNDKRIRLWAQMDAGEVWNILTRLGAYQ